MIPLGKTGSSIMPKLRVLNLSYNYLNGSLPKNIGRIMPSLGDLLLGNNLINGLIPNSLCQNHLIHLDLSNNKLSGEIPNCWSYSQFLKEINLSSNKLSGVLPSSFGYLSSLFWLHLNNNNLQGQLPKIVSKELLILDLGENPLSGSIPSWTKQTFPSLQILRLRQNKLNGNIPSQLCQLATLKILDLSRNNLEGSIPWCIGNLTGMTLNNSLDKANTKLPPYLSHVAAEIRAPPPAEPEWSKEDVKQVTKGREDDYIKILKLVVNMDLSENKLVGPIPQGNQFSTYDSSVYANNPYLCGHELPNKCPGDDSSEVLRNKGYEDKDGKKEKLEKLFFYFVVAVGFATGFWGVFAVLLLNKSWRHVYFRWVEDVADDIYVAVVIKVAKLKKWMIRNRDDG
ncbi:hypothetical protein RIF29_21076 [Crotalaria pallida]|uniref:Uncharacterized protein n=1 Tax=Crotalaria pallida TaxID=3830 RepID=A0AAN9F6N8_CROPI